MSNNISKPFDISEALEKLNHNRKKLNLEKFGSVDRVVVESIDDVFSKFHILINNHPAYSRDVYSSNIDVKSQLKNNFGESIEIAARNKDDKAIHNICSSIAKLYVPKDLGLKKKFFEKNALTYALKSFVREYVVFNKYKQKHN